MSVSLTDKYTVHTSVFGFWDEIQYQTEADSIPLFLMLLLIHEKKVLLQYIRMSRAHIHGSTVYPRTGSVIIGFECSDFK